MASVKSDNRHLAILSGYSTRWRHSSVAETVTITRASGEPAVLNRVVINNTTASAIVIRDTAVGVIGVLKASIAEGSYQYGLPLKGNLVVENPGGSDLTIVFSNN